MTKEQGEKFQVKKTGKNFILGASLQLPLPPCPQGPGAILLPSFSKGFVVSKFHCAPTTKSFHKHSWVLIFKRFNKNFITILLNYF